MAGLVAAGGEDGGDAVSRQEDFEAAVQLFQDGDLAAAEAACRQILKVSRKHAGALQLLGAVTLRNGRPEHAIKFMNDAVRAAPKDAGAYVNLGEVYRGLGNFDKAVAAYGKALKIDPARAEAHCNLGSALLAQGKPEAALKSYERAIELKPRLAEAHYNKANLLAEQGDAEAARAAYRKAISANPRLADAHYNLGNLQAGLGALIDAKSCYQQAVALRYDFPKAHYNLGNALRLLGQWEEARAAYAKALSLDPSLAGAELYLGTAAKRVGRLGDARAHFERALKKDPNLAEAQSELAHILLLQGESEAAIQGFRRALELDPSFGWANLGLATALAEVGRLEEAHEASLEAVRLRRSYVRPCRTDRPEGRVLVMKGLEDGRFTLRPNDQIDILVGMNNADDHMDQSRFQIGSFYLDGITPGEEAAALPQCDVIFNAISDPDAMPKSLASAARAAAAAEVPVINDPKLIGLTRREEVYRRLVDLPGLLVPKTIRLQEPLRDKAEVASLLADEGLEPPLLVRRVGTHTGISLEKVDNVAQLANFLAAQAEGEFYLTQFHDYARGDGLYAKMRVFFLGGRPLPSQLFIGPNWNVRVTDSVMAHMMASVELMAESERFMAEPEAHLGPQAVTALAAIHERLPLDYFGVDFAQLPDGRLLIFEANAVMLLPYVETVELGLRKPYIQALEAALSDLVSSRIPRRGGSYDVSVTFSGKGIS